MVPTTLPFWLKRPQRFYLFFSFPMPHELAFPVQAVGSVLPGGASCLLLVVGLALGCWGCAFACGFLVARLWAVPADRLSARERYIQDRVSRARAGLPLSPLKVQ